MTQADGGKFHAGGTQGLGLGACLVDDENDINLVSRIRAKGNMEGGVNCLFFRMVGFWVIFFIALLGLNYVPSNMLQF